MVVENNSNPFISIPVRIVTDTGTGTFTAPQDLPAWSLLTAHARRLKPRTIIDLFVDDPARASRFTYHFSTPFDQGNKSLIIDFSKQQIDDNVLASLVQLAREARLAEGIRDLFNSEPVNFTECRAASHMAVRGSCPPPSRNGADTRAMRAFALALRRGEITGASGEPIRHLINLGIGGSDLGPRVTVEALGNLDTKDGIEVEFVSNIDPQDLDRALAKARPQETLFVVSSKSFTTSETLINATFAREWLQAKLGERADISAHFAAVTRAVDMAVAFGIQRERVFPIPDWVGGRYSVWSAIGLPLMVAIGGAFDEFLAGANAMDEHFRNAEFEQNLPVFLALIGLWNTDFLDIETLAALPYSHGLRSFPVWLEQLEMESNGKRTLKNGQFTQVPTAPIIWGGVGVPGQHSFHQLLYQGTRRAALDFIVPIGKYSPRQRTLVDNAFAQSAALMIGRDIDAARTALSRKHLSPTDIERLTPHLVSPGNQPSNTIILPRLDAFHLGCLLALYEHKVFVQAWIWGINPFDQYGVELGKDIARALAAGELSEQDASTTNLVTLAEAFWLAENEED